MCYALAAGAVRVYGALIYIMICYLELYAEYAVRGTHDDVIYYSADKLPIIPSLQVQHDIVLEIDTPRAAKDMLRHHGMDSDARIFYTSTN
jgi:hypothetical protein